MLLNKKDFCPSLCNLPNNMLHKTYCHYDDVQRSTHIIITLLSYIIMLNKRLILRSLGNTICNNLCQRIMCAEKCSSRGVRVVP